MGHLIHVYLFDTPICVWDIILSHISIIFACFISLQFIATAPTYVYMRFTLAQVNGGADASIQYVLLN